MTSSVCICFAQLIWEKSPPLCLWKEESGDFLAFFKVFFYFATCKSEILQAGLWASHVIAESRYGLIINLKY